MRRLAIALALVVLAAGLAGCVGGSDDGGGAQTQSTDANDTRGTLAEPNVSFEKTDDVYRFDSEDVNETRWENASFSPAACFACPDSQHRYDVTDMLATGAPTLLQAEVDYEANVFDGTGVYLATDGAEVYRYNGSFEDFTAVVAPQGGTVEVVVEGFFPDANTEIAYELRIEARSNASVLAPEVPIAFPEPEDPSGLVVDGEDLEGEARLMLWDGQDAFLGHHPIDGETTINVSEAEGGPLVGYLAGAEGGAARVAPVNASATDTTMRPLATTIGEQASAVGAAEEVTVEAEPDTVPFRAGLFLQGSFDAGTQYSGELTVPNGTLVSFESGGYLTGSDSRFTWWGEPGAAELGPTSYVGTFSFSAATGGEAGVFWQTYER